ncbi:tumor protein 63-like [Dendronephthya gigantea]|uniref:tumor protein 63-like n=1 Tax=Dendronephthya gigantea TaxID=151771 RepID=UPI00106B2831|nr:tumor protein 63-like [Dendronephthya gigantea]
MSQPEPSSQSSTDTQEIYSQGSFEEIWESLGRTFSNPDKVIQGIVTDEIPFEVQFKDSQIQDNIELVCKERTFKRYGQPNSPTFSQQFCDLLQSPAPLDTSNTSNGHAAVSVNGTLSNNNRICEPVELPPILPNKGHPGEYNFEIGFETNNEPITKATPWVYVTERQKLFVKMQCVCPILFYIRGNPPPGTGVRGILMYKRPEHYKDIVTRCPNHKNMCKEDMSYQDHVMRCENPSTIYQTCPKTERFSLFLPLSAVNTVEGGGYFKELFKFTCFNSCVGGMNRRPTYLLFRLECGGTIYGRAVREVRICASPGRDSTEKEPSTNVKNTKNTDKRNEPTSTSDIITPMPLSSAQSPGSSPTTAYPPRASVLMSTRKDPTSAPEPFQFPAVSENQATKRQYPVGTEGFVFKKVKKSYGNATDPTDDDQVFTIAIRGRERYEIMQRINEGLHMMDDVKVPALNSNRYANSDIESSQEFTRIQPKVHSIDIKKEKADPSQCDVSPQSSQELSQLSRSSSNASSQSSATQAFPEYSAKMITMKRTISLKTSPVPKSVLLQETMAKNI